MKRKQISPWWLAAVFVWYIINIRVEAGISTALERTLDGLVGGLLLLLVLYYAARFFGLIEIRDSRNGSS